MKRRLTRAYDNTIMPDSCARNIEQRLQRELEYRKSGLYTKTVSPLPPRRSSWLTAAAAVCLMLVLSVGGSVLVLRGLPAMDRQSPETIATVLPDAVNTPSDHYAEVTDFSVYSVEAFAETVRYDVLRKNWEALKDKVHFPLVVEDQEIQDWQLFLDWINGFSLYSSSWEKMEQETCRAMFCNWQGICMADGFVWINEIDSSLKITAFQVPVQEQPPERNQVPQAFSAVLRGEAVEFPDRQGELCLEEYCAALWGDATVDQFAVVDMDGDHVCEIVACVQLPEEQSAAYLVLRREGDEIISCPFWPGELLELKKDGSFLRRGRDCRLVFYEESSYYGVEEVKTQRELPPAQWYAYPCQRPDLLLRACEYETGTGWNQLPGIPYSYFESVVQGRASNNLQTFLYRGMDHTVMENDKIYIFDPDAPGTVVYGTVTEENGSQRFSELGFYMATGEKEYMAEVRNMLSEEPEYWVDAHLPALGSMGRQVFSPEELIGYFGFTPMPDEETLKDQQAIRSLVDAFVAACLTGDPRDMEPYLAENAQGRVGKFPKDKALELIDYGILPDQTMGEWGRYAIHPKAQIQGQEGQFQLYLELVKQPDGWKVETYRVER